MCQLGSRLQGNESHSPPSNIGLLDYTCNASRLAIWGEAYRLSLVMTRLWLNIRPIYHNEISRSLILLQMDELNVYLRFGRNFARPRLFLNAGRN